ncbi:DgyrCDS531 [Dimorphilus gyrociliatus]|uniref:DgyrCDS531 n=1 Tax=Dimorphilus gyrociliatus TaxID=2664684 RepID=A0A7I8V7N2_9ANNE|nr:DgyrCDS531 [Dimorphilus gyrociliatus]
MSVTDTVGAVRIQEEEREVVGVTTMTVEDIPGAAPAPTHHIQGDTDDDHQENPKASRCVGVFGLSLYTHERDIRQMFEKYGEIEDVQLVYDRQTGRSRGFCFIYYKNLEDSIEAKERAAGMELDGARIRVDFSITERAHTPTPVIIEEDTGITEDPIGVLRLLTTEDRDIRDQDLEAIHRVSLWD